MNRQLSPEPAATNSSFCTLAWSQRWQKGSLTRSFPLSRDRLNFLVAAVRHLASALASHCIHAMDVMENRFSELQTRLFIG